MQRLDLRLAGRATPWRNNRQGDSQLVTDTQVLENIADLDESMDNNPNDDYADVSKWPEYEDLLAMQSDEESSSGEVRSGGDEAGDYVQNEITQADLLDVVEDAQQILADYDHTMNYGISDEEEVVDRVSTHTLTHEEICCICACEFDESSVDSIRITTSCEHQYCRSCFVLDVKVGVSSPEDFPPRCHARFDCNKEINVPDYAEVLPPEYINKFLQHNEEWRSKWRIYCAKSTCQVWIPDKNFGDTAAFGKCGKCDGWTCRQCRGLFSSHNFDDPSSFMTQGPRHTHVACPTDAATVKIQEALMKEDGEKANSCPRCNHLIVLEEGCNHMT